MNKKGCTIVVILRIMPIFASLLWIKVFSYFCSLKSPVSFSECRAFSLAKINFISLLDKLPSMIRKIA